ncbi:hypothetical protein [Pleomorphomonas sp. NRK KF1]|uniref:glycine-rich domain-containing protein n=1 Tax=Pleomorphomonas sp. NRK KF1 TaxID=2943000 RepID=UPI0020433796|nr:hypothetical protein [Pleomorphomonas sp. NRK KF1]MCM5555539.1 hypothetical protein [Pleomorphomonas sp. NRK KF1]
MTQYGYEPLSPDDSGSTLLERVNGVVPALVTNHKGPARPGYIQPGMMWIDDSGSEWLLNLYDGAGDVAIAAIDPETHQALSQWVPETRTIASGLGVRINGGESATLAGTVTVGLDLATPAETVAGEIGNKPAAPDGVHAAIAAALAGIPTGGARIKRIVQIAASCNYTPSPGTTMAFVVLQGAGGGGAGGYAGNSATPGGGGAGAFAIALLNVVAGTSYPVIVGAGGGGGPVNTGANGNPGGATTITVDGVVYSAGGGAAGVQNGAGAGGVPSGSFLEARAGLGGFTTSAGGQALTWMGGARRGDGGSGGGVNAGWAGLSGYVTIVEIGA